jgi:hypothetical protein
MLRVSQANKLLIDGYLLGQFMKFCGHRNPKTIISYYLDIINNIDSVVTYLGLEPRRDLIQDFRSAFIKRNLDF